jgi:Arc/MetJ-type ribon-helix-helix transcriptional regulator
MVYMSSLEQVTVALPPELRTYVRQEAAARYASEASIIRRALAEAAERRRREAEAARQVEGSA